MISITLHAFHTMFTKPYRSWLYKTLLYTIGLLVVVWVIIQQIISGILFFDDPTYQGWVATIAGILTFLGLTFLIPPVTSIVAGFFLDDMAVQFETEFYPNDPIGTEPKFTSALAIATKFALIMVVVNIVALLSVLLLGIGFIIFFIANAWLLGKEYFQMVAIRHLSKQEASALYQQEGGRIFLGGCLICGFASIPVLNFFTAPFATYFMVHLFKRLNSGERRVFE